MTDTRCNCEHERCHPDSNCPSVDGLEQREYYGIKQTLCAGCRALCARLDPQAPSGA